MKLVHRYDENSFFVESIMLDANKPIPNDCTDTPLPSGLFKAKFDNGEWVEGLSQTEIDSIKNAPQPVSPIEQLQKDQADLVLQLVMKGVL